MSLWTTLVLAFVSATSDSSDPQKVPLEDATELAVTMGSGDIEVRARRGNEVQILEHKTLGATGCGAHIAHQGKTLGIAVNDPNGRPCAVDIILFVPPKLGVRIDQGSGKTMISGTRGPLALKMGTGNAVVGGTFDQLDIDIGSGSMSVQGLAGDGRVRVGHGNVQIFFASKAKSKLDLEVGTGNVTLFADEPIAASVATANVQAPASPWQSDAPARIRVTGSIGTGRLALRATSR